MKKELTNAGRTDWKYGIIGEETGYENLRVGDLVVFEKTNGNLSDGIIARRYNGVNKEYGVMGYFGKDLDKMDIKLKVLNFNLVTNEILKKHGLKAVEYKEKMTIEQIEEALGYSIEIVGEL